MTDGGGGGHLDAPLVKMTGRARRGCRAQRSGETGMNMERMLMSYTQAVDESRGRVAPPRLSPCSYRQTDHRRRRIPGLGGPCGDRWGDIGDSGQGDIGSEVSGGPAEPVTARFTAALTFCDQTGERFSWRALKLMSPISLIKRHFGGYARSELEKPAGSQSPGHPVRYFVCDKITPPSFSLGLSPSLWNNNGKILQLLPLAFL